MFLPRVPEDQVMRVARATQAELVRRKKDAQKTDNADFQQC
jgi:hypothetical protein